jgi:hypothetical protein
MNVIESNKLIAEFMGGKCKNACSVPLNEGEIWLPFHGVNKIHLLHYENSWDWLMPVVERIYDSDEYYEYLQTYSTTFGGGVELTTNITNVYDAVVEFIKWYNENK